MVRGGATEYQAYRAKLASLLPALQAALKPGGTYILRVAHDDWCPVPARRTLRLRPNVLRRGGERAVIRWLSMWWC